MTAADRAYVRRLADNLRRTLGLPSVAYANQEAAFLGMQAQIRRAAGDWA